MPFSRSSRPCRFCQQSRWVMTVLMLGIMAGMLLLQLAP